MSGIRIALTKGRIKDKTIELLEQAGYDCSEIKKNSRKLIVPLPDSSIEVVLAKAPDVITYIEHGVCDIGIVGKDTIMEMGRQFCEVLDLGFGKCRFVLAVRRGEDFYGTYKKRTIATKYPEVARAHFAEKNVPVEIIKIEGSVELAPLLGLADGIVDIVETGNTLKENGLEPVEDIADISTRLIVNLVSMKMKKDEVSAFLKRCEAALEG